MIGLQCLNHFACGEFPVLAALTGEFPPSLLAFTLECQRTAMVTSRLIPLEDTRLPPPPPSQRKHVMFQFSSLNRIRFLSSWKKHRNVQMEIFKMRSHVLLWRGGRGGLLSDQMERGAVLECLVGESERSPALNGALCSLLT